MENKTIRPFEKVGGHTTFDNAILDHIMPKCKPNTWKIVCATIRKTTGWNKDYDRISLSQYKELTGIGSKVTLIDAIQDALDNKFIEREVLGNSFIYTLNKNYEMEISTETVPVQILNQKQYRNCTDNGTETVHTKEKRKNKEKIVFSFPDLLASSPEFMEAWNEFVEHRGQMKKKLTPLAAQRLLTKLCGYALPVSISALQTSVERGWLGVFPDNIKSTQPGQPDRKTTITENGMYL